MDLNFPKTFLISFIGLFIFVGLYGSIVSSSSTKHSTVDDMIFVNNNDMQNTEKAFLGDEDGLWNNGQVFYRFENVNGDPIFKDDDVSFVKSILQEIQIEVPCISFIEVTAHFSGGHLIFTSAGDADHPPNGCYSYVGSVGSQGGKNGQILNLGGPECLNRRVVTHELLHALGCTHEQNRFDRNKFVQIYEDNIISDHIKNFHQKDRVNYGVMSTPYDLSSIMHYSRDAFSTDGSDTILPLSDAYTLPSLNNSRGMSIIDIVELSRNYAKQTETTCLPSLDILEQYYQLENTEKEDVQINQSVCGGNKTLCDITGKYLAEIGTRVLATRDLEQIVRDKSMAENHWMLNSVELDPQIGRKVIEYCSSELKIEEPIVEINRRKFWLSLLEREAFYLECLNKFEACRLQRRGYDTIMNLKQYAKDFDKESKRQGTTFIFGGAAQVVGGVIQGAGVIMAPFSGGTSLVLTYAGTVASIAGSLTSTVNAIGASVWSKKKIEDSKKLMEATENDLTILNYLIGLYMESQTKRVNFFENSQDIKIIEDKFDELTQQYTRSAPQSFVNIIVGARAVYLKNIKGTKFILKSKLLFSTIRQSVFKLTPALVRNHYAIVSKYSWSASKKLPDNCKLGMGMIANSAVSLMNIGLGSWDIITGERQIDGHSDIADTFKATAKSMSYILEATLRVYEDTIPDKINCSVENANYRYLEVTKISLRSIDGQGSKKTRLMLTSLNPVDSNEPGECMTDNFQVPRSNEAGDGFWFSLDNTNLGDCRLMRIYKNSAKIKIINDDSDAVSVDYVTISTESDFTPSYQCTLDGTIASLKSSSLYSYNGCKGSKCHQELTCFQHQGLKMIKIKTCEQSGAGTDAAAKIQISQYKKWNDGKGKLLQDNEDNPSYCFTDYLDNPGNDWEYGDVDTYRIDSLGDCSKSFHDEFIPEEGYLGVRAILNNHWWLGKWCTDGMKLYVATEKEYQTKTFRCDVWGGKGLGTWKHGNDHICQLQRPNKRGLKKIRLHIADYYFAASSGELQIKITRQDKRSCYTNVFHIGYSENTWVDIDGGGYEKKKNEMNDHLGMCEDFIIDGSSVTIHINKRDGNLVGIDAVQLHAGEGESLVNADDTAFIVCYGKEIWAEDGQVYIGTPNGKSWTYSSWISWESKSAEWICQYESFVTIKAMHIRLCEENTAGSDSSFKAEFTNIDKGNCKKNEVCHCHTQELPIKGLDSNDFQSVYNLGGDCHSLQIYDNKVYLNLFNMDRTDSLCLTQIWVDVSDSAGNTQQLKCRYNSSASKLIVIQKDGTRLPMLCE
eukprot:GFUD01035555.1.p1 GENE.GFUD01035555.1~~GFUD01035555.1.p1  ORF type:complete len:1295 (+),score=228.20 GFUD01035555.1:99-3983(+)